MIAPLIRTELGASMLDVPSILETALPLPDSVDLGSIFESLCSGGSLAVYDTARSRWHDFPDVVPMAAGELECRISAYYNGLTDLVHKFLLNFHPGKCSRINSAFLIDYSFV